MKREVKFKGKRKGSTHEWLYGDLAHINGQTYVFNRDTDPMNSPEWFEVLPESVGMFTGIADKCGDHIYEGDIIRNKFGTGTVRWDDTRAGFVIEWTNTVLDDAISYFPFGIKTTEVIGNIHENPELLEGTGE